MARILIVDDDPALLSSVSRALELKGHEVAQASDGRRALEQFRAQPADLVLTDIYMPDVDGLEFTRALGREFVGAKIVAMSGGVLQDRDQALEIARRMGAVATLPKPFALEQLYEVVSTVLPGSG